MPLRSFRTLLRDLGTLTYNIARTGANPDATIVITSRPTPIQDKAFALLNLSPTCFRQTHPNRINNDMTIGDLRAR